MKRPSVMPEVLMAVSRMFQLTTLVALLASATACAAFLPPTPPTPSSQTRTTARPTPKPALTMAGRVAVDPTLLVAEKLAVPSESGLLILGNNGGNIVSSNGAGLTSKTKLGRSLLAVQGMQVTAYSQLDGKQVAGPVSTDADGRYKLAFDKKPQGNLLLVAAVASRATDDRFSYDTLVPATEGEVAVDTSDITRATTRGMVRELPLRLKPIFEARANGRAPTIYLSLLPHAKLREALGIVDTRLAAMTAEQIQALLAADAPTQIARRMTAVVDLTHPASTNFYNTVGEVRAFEETLPDYLDLPAQIAGLAFKFTGAAPIEQALVAKGMAADKAKPLAEKLDQYALELAVMLAETAIAQQDAVLTPLTP